MRPHPFVIVVALGALLGVVFSAFSTYDFMAHLDRQLHGFHCSYLPGIVATEEGEASGCHAALMSPYSSVLREHLWGGIPVSLPGLSVFAFLLFWAVDLVLGRRQQDPRATVLLLAGAAVPLLTSAVMGYLAATRVGAACKLCIGMYAAAVIVFAGSLGLWWRAFRASRRPRGDAEGEKPEARRMGLGALAAAVALAGAFVLVPLAVYAAMAPSFDRYVGRCGTLPAPDDPEGVLVPLGGSEGGTPAVVVLDPLCSFCRTFDERLRHADGQERLARRALLFPLDRECNWMLDESLHPGACALSEAVLCAGDDAEEVLSWSFAEQERLRAAAAEDPDAPGRLVSERFPELRECIGSPAVRARLNRALRWAVGNQLPVLSPQLYVNGVRLCDEDMDLGLELMLSRLLRHVGTLPRGGAPEREAEPAEEPAGPRETRRPAPRREREEPSPPPPRGSGDATAPEPEEAEEPPPPTPADVGPPSRPALPPGAEEPSEAAEEAPEPPASPEVPHPGAEEVAP